MKKENILSGKTWVLGDYIDVYQILSPDYWYESSGKSNLNAEELRKYALLGADPEFAAKALDGQYAFIVAGRNFAGGGKSTEQPIFTIKGTGVKAVIAESCSRYFFRNAINNGLFVMICEGITANVKTGDELQVNPSSGEIRNKTTGIQLKSEPLSEIALEILNSGGYLPYARKRMAMK